MYVPLSLYAGVSDPQVFGGSLDASREDDSRLTPTLWWSEEGEERDGGMLGATVEGRRFAFNEGKTGRQTADDAEGREADRSVKCQSSPLPPRSRHSN